MTLHTYARLLPEAQRESLNMTPAHSPSWA